MPRSKALAAPGTRELKTLRTAHKSSKFAVLGTLVAFSVSEPVPAAGSTARKASSAVGSYALGGNILHDGLLLAEQLVKSIKDEPLSVASERLSGLRRKYQGIRHVSLRGPRCTTADGPGEALYRWLDPRCRYAIL